MMYVTCRCSLYCNFQNPIQYILFLCTSKVEPIIEGNVSGVPDSYFGHGLNPITHIFYKWLGYYVIIILSYVYSAGSINSGV